MDLIDRKAMLKHIEKIRQDALMMDDIRESNIIMMGMNLCEEAVRNQPSAQQEQRWIPCSERLPEPRIDVWCNSDMGQMVGYYDEYAETWYGRDYLELIVTAWMPLPEPYNAESEDKE